MRDVWPCRVDYPWVDGEGAVGRVFFGPDFIGGLTFLVQSGRSWYRGTSPIRSVLLLGPYSRLMPGALRWSYGGGSFL